MSFERDYRKRVGLDPDRLDTDFTYLAGLTSIAAIELDKISLERSNEREHILEFTELLRKYQIDETEANLANNAWQPSQSVALWHAFRGAKPKMTRMSEVGLEMWLFRKELETLDPTDKEKVAHLRGAMVRTSRFFAEYIGDSRLYAA